MTLTGLTNQSDWTKHLTFKVEVGTSGVWMTSSVVLETAADWQLSELTADSVSNVIVLTAALPLPLNTHTHNLC